MIAAGAGPGAQTGTGTGTVAGAGAGDGTVDETGLESGWCQRISSSSVDDGRMLQQFDQCRLGRNPRGVASAINAIELNRL